MQRKTVTVLFCDVTGSTGLGESLDPEALRALLAGYFERMRAIVELHGGTVEKFIGDAVMAIFGVPAAHEDDALRAVRAAAEMREAFPELGVRARIGLNTGTVVTDSGEGLATGDAVNVAARLEQAADPGEVLLGEPTLALVREAVEVEAAGPLELKGKAEPVAAYRLIRVLAAPERRHESRFVGRKDELAAVHDAWSRAREGRRCELVTVVGDAGVGKSRLVAEALASVDAGAVGGRCLAYGEGISYWPVVEVLRQLDARPADPGAAASVEALLGGRDDATSADEIAWAFRKTLEQAAAEEPVAVVFDDVHAGEDTFLDLVEHVALLSSGAPILLVCLARPELGERRPEWPVTLRLEPLPPDDVEELIPPRFAAPLRERIARAAGGNPLFIGELLAMTDEGDVVVPPTLQALLAARLDALEPAELAVLQCAAVEGELFHRGAVQALLPEEPKVTPRLAALARKGLVAPDRPQLEREDGFRFRHLLVRDAAYEALPKSDRAELHERFASWLAERGGSLVELDELVGFHLEQSVRYRAELGQERDEAVASVARERLTAAGRRALVRLDFATAAGLLGRAAELGPLDLGIEVDLIDALTWSTKGAEALARARSIVQRAAATDDARAGLCGQILETALRIHVEPVDAASALEALVADALPGFQAAGDQLALRIAYRALGDAANMRAQMDRMVAAYAEAAAHTGPAGLTALVGYQSHGRFYGSTPLTEFLAWQDEQDPRERRSYWLRSHCAGALARLGRVDEARSVLRELLEELAERGGAAAVVAAVSVYGLEIELLADNPAAAVEAGEESCRLREELGRFSELSTSAAALAEAYFELGRLDEAERWATRAAELGSDDDAITQLLWRQALARVLAARGEHVAAERLAREAVAISATTEDLNSQAGALADLGAVLALAGRPVEAAAAAGQALERFEAKENVVMAERTRGQLAALRPEVG